ncbi:N-acetylmuramoyl-L-alanine amidase [Paenibacillus lautus]|uniref:N-acetylmuramoyl-L-alanine amidase n=1 Tax=Paenibacillus lautus TaxID=1401 RepID=UPI00384EA65A
MYDLLIGLFEAIFRHGWSLSTAGAIVFLLLKQKKMKKRLKKYLPFMFSEDSEVAVYIGNQLVIMKNIELIMKEMNIESWHANDLNEEAKSLAKKPRTYSPLSLETTTTVQNVENYTERRDYNMGLKQKIDAGHGGQDPGALGVTGTKEKDFALTLTLKVEERLKRDKKVKPLLTRSKDEFVELKERVRMANKNKVDSFISIHANSTGKTGSASGTETLYTREESKPLATIIHKHVAAATGLPDRGVKQQNIHVTRETTMPAILLEIAFINHPDDEKKLFDPAFQDRVADAIVAGIYEYFGITIEAPQPVVPIRKEMDVTVHTDPIGRFTGYNIKGTTWVPSRPIGEQMGGRIGYTEGKVTINGEPVETQNIGGIGYVTARDMSRLLGARIFWDKKEPNRVDIFTK